MLHVAICDDQLAELHAAHQAAANYFEQRPNHVAEIHDFSSSMDFLDYLEKAGSCDIALLDIYMPGMTGIQIAQELRSRHDHMEIVFLTTSSEFAVDAFALKAAHYLIKPFNQTQMDEALDRAMAHFLPREPKKIVLQGENGSLQTVEADSILYVENFRHHREVYTPEGELKETRRTLTMLAEELEQLCPGLFILPYRGYIVNQKAIRAVTKDGIALQSGTRIPIKAGDFRKLRDAYFEWAFRKEGMS